jgi:hypothetical protein
MLNIVGNYHDHHYREHNYHLHFADFANHLLWPVKLLHPFFDFCYFSLYLVYKMDDIYRLKI